MKRFGIVKRAYIWLILSICIAVWGGFVFIMNANLIPPDSKELIKKYINHKVGIYTIVVDDLDYKINHI